MIRTFYPGGIYGEADPSGARVILLPEFADTHLGPIPYDGGTKPLYVRLYPSPFQFAGQASNRFGTMHYRGGQWVLDPRIAHGESGCIFDPAGHLHIIEPRPHQSSQGYRYVAPDGRLVTGDETYGPHFGLTQWSEYGGLRIGQGHDGGGVRVWDGAHLRELTPGDCRFIRVRGVGEHVAITYVVPGGVWVVQTTLAELRALPVVGVAQPNPGPTPPPKPAPLPEPTPMSFPLPTQVLGIRARYVARFPIPQIRAGESQDAFEQRCRVWCFGLAEQVVFETGDSRWGVKNAGGGRPQSKDAIAFNGSPLVSWDLMLGVGTGTPTLVETPAGEDVTGQVFMPVKPFDHLGGVILPGPTPLPAPETTTPGAALDVAISTLRAQVAVLQRQVADLSARPVGQPTPLNGRYTLRFPRGYMRHDWSDNLVHVDRTVAGDGEIVTLEPVQ